MIEYFGPDFGLSEGAAITAFHHDALCAVAAEHDGPCVDLRPVLNGPNLNQPRDVNTQERCRRWRTRWSPPDSRASRGEGRMTQAPPRAAGEPQPGALGPDLPPWVSAWPSDECGRGGGAPLISGDGQ